MLPDHPLARLFDIYTIVEKQLVRAVGKIAHPFCSRCPDNCCKETICRESLESPFLRRLVTMQHVHYDSRQGWLSPDGCRLAYGRPLVCHGFFCEQIMVSTAFKESNLQQALRAFNSAGKRACRDTHLICVDPLSSISPAKLVKLHDQFAKLITNQESTGNHQK